MTATPSSKQPGPDPHSTHRDPANQPERPGAISWELLGASDYRTAVTDLGSWLAWLVPTYRIPPSIIPPCWFLHPGLIEELGHLWTGWRITRHSDSGVGMVGLDWDSHRERATSRLRELVATAGCNGTNHSPKPGPALSRDDNLWEANLQSETDARTTKFTEQAIMSAASEVLRRAERRNDLALDILRHIATDPGDPTEDEKIQCAGAVDNSTWTAAAVAQRRSQDTRMQLGSIACEESLTMELAAARQYLLARIAKGCTPEDFEAASTRWIAATARAAPAADAVLRAAASKAGLAAAAHNLTSSQARHDGIADLLPGARED